MLKASMNNDFENAWTAMVNRHNLETYKWVKKMFDDRHLRAEAYLKENYFVVCKIAKIVRVLMQTWSVCQYSDIIVRLWKKNVQLARKIKGYGNMGWLSKQRWLTSLDNSLENIRRTCMLNFTKNSVEKVCAQNC